MNNDNIVIKYAYIANLDDNKITIELIRIAKIIPKTVKKLLL